MTPVGTNNTEFAQTEAAWAALSPAMQALLLPLDASARPRRTLLDDRGIIFRLAAADYLRRGRGAATTRRRGRPPRNKTGTTPRARRTATARSTRGRVEILPVGPDFATYFKRSRSGAIISRSGAITRSPTLQSSAGTVLARPNTERRPAGTGRRRQIPKRPWPRRRLWNSPWKKRTTSSPTSSTRSSRADRADIVLVGRGLQCASRGRRQQSNAARTIEDGLRLFESGRPRRRDTRRREETRSSSPRPSRTASSA